VEVYVGERTGEAKSASVLPQRFPGRNAGWPMVRAEAGFISYFRWLFGAARGIRTPDPIITNNLAVSDTRPQTAPGPDKFFDFLSSWLIK
jgi:hypothetical protein